MISEREFIIRLAVAFALGSLIGLERQFRHRGAGLRTNALAAAETQGPIKPPPRRWPTTGPSQLYDTHRAIRSNAEFA